MAGLCHQAGWHIYKNEAQALWRGEGEEGAGTGLPCPILDRPPVGGWAPLHCPGQVFLPQVGRLTRAAVITQRTLEPRHAWAFHPYRDGGAVVSPILQMRKPRHREKFLLVCSSRWSWDSNVATFLRGLHSVRSL